ncbi:MAG: IS1634 family transposase, partial [Thermotogota bacterium]|nr:IS1634 family transposase [Thermotogota bacterium]
MFIKTTKSGNHHYAQLVESYRKDGNTKHRVLLNLGRLDHIKNNPSFQNLAIRLAELSALKEKTNTIEDISDAQIFNYGYLAYRRLWEQFDLPKMLTEAMGKAQFDLEKTSFLMAISHLLAPNSKRGTHARQERYFNLPECKLHHLYRSLDILERSKEMLEANLFNLNRSLFNMKVDVVFFDVTTFHFESVHPDSLRDFGFSKNGKFNEVQVVLGMLIDQTGRPVGYELFPGHTFDGNTLEAALDQLERRLGIQRVIIVADRGINSKLNLKRICDKGYHHIVASRLKSMPKHQLKQALDNTGFSDITDREGNLFRYKSLDYCNRFKADRIYELPEQLIVTYCAKRAKKDQADRQRLITKAKLLLANKGKIKSSAKRGGKRYVKEMGNVDWVLDEEAIARDELFDGYYAFQTSAENLSPQEVLTIYGDLWKIEESFRVMKSTLEVRPVFHWTESRIKGHFVLCFLAFLLERTLEFKLSEAGLDSSPEQIREALNSLNFVQVKVKKKSFLIKTKALALAHDIWRLLRLKPSKNVTPVEEMEV